MFLDKQPQKVNLCFDWLTKYVSKGIMAKKKSLEFLDIPLRNSVITLLKLSALF